MDEYKKRFIAFLLSTGALKVFDNPYDDRTLKSRRISPWFVNIGDFDDGETSSALGEFYADAIINAGIKGDVLYGIPDKGREIATATAIEMAKKGKNVPRFSTRRVPKDHGEASAVQSYGDARTVREFIAKMQNLSQTDRIKAWVIGRAPQEGQSVIQLDDVFTAGDVKYEAVDMLKFLGDFKLPLLAIGVDRQEVAIDSREAIVEYQEKTGTPVVSVVNALDVYDFLKNPPLLTSGQPYPVNKAALERLTHYIRVYGTQAAREGIIQREGRLEQRIVERDRSIIPACDVPFEQFEELVRQTADVEGIGAYKIPAISGRKGWERWVEVARKHTDKPLIYDHQKAGTDIPDTAREFMQELKAAGFDAVILFPQSGPETERAWIYRAFESGLKVIVGGRMTHPAYAVSEGGWITDKGAMEMYQIAARAGVGNFVVPGNKPEVITEIKNVIEAEGVEPDFYSPGFFAQGGKISEAAQAAGKRLKGIVGRGIYQANDMHAAALEYTSQV